MSKTYLLAIVCPDKPGLISAITACLFDLGINLGDANFVILGEGAEFSAVLEVPESLTQEAVEHGLSTLSELADADIRIKPFNYGTLRSDTGLNTHHILLEGQDQPGLVARLTELLSDYDSNIERMDTRKLSKTEDANYVIDLWVSIPEHRTEACIAAVNNTAAALGMTCRASQENNPTLD